VDAFALKSSCSLPQLVTPTYTTSCSAFASCILRQVAVGILLKYDFEMDATQMLFSGPTVALICLYVAGFAWSW
jgi:hypothetical protein